MSDSVIPIRASGLVKAFGKRRVLDGLNLEIPRGSVVGLLGKNGSGKTTFIKWRGLGLIRVDAGDVRILGEDAWSLSESVKGRLGYVPQVVALYPWMRVWQLTKYIGPFYPRWNHTLVVDLMRRFELDANAKVGTLSVGTLQKLAIILCGHEPELLVLDEPAASLDPVARREFLKAILDISADEGRTVLFSTHITSDLERVADRVAILREGKIAYDGGLDELKDSVKRLHISAAGALPVDLGVAGSFGGRVEGSVAVMTVRGDWAGAAAEMERAHRASVRVENLNLEDIFLEMDHEPGKDAVAL